MPTIGSAPLLDGAAPGAAVPVAGVDSAAVVAAAADPARRLAAEGSRCWAQTVEAVRAAPRIAVVSAFDVRRKPRLLAFLGLALADGPGRASRRKIGHGARCDAMRPLP
jgi:hypothetical protein